MDYLAQFLTACKALSEVIKAEQAALDAYYADTTGTVAYPGWQTRSDCSWLMDKLKAMTGREWLKSNGVEVESVPVAESGRKLSNSTVTALNSVISSINALIASNAQPDEDTISQVDSALQAAADEAEAVASEAMKGEKARPEGKCPDCGKPKVECTCNDAAEMEARRTRHSVVIDLTPFSGAKIVESVWLLGESTAADGHPVFDMLMLQEGKSKNKVKYGKTAICEGSPLFEGAALYVDHPANARDGDLSRSLATKGGWWSDVRYETAIPTASGAVNGMRGNLNLFTKEASPVPWLEGMIRESLANGRGDLVGISICATAKGTLKRDEEGIYKEVESFGQVISVDAVSAPGANGQALGVIAASEGVDQDVMKLEELLEALKALPEEQRATLLKEMGLAATPGSAGGGTATMTLTQEDVAKLANIKPEELTLAVENFTKTQTLLSESMHAMNLMTFKTGLEARLSGVKLPGKVKDLIRAEIGDNILTVEALELVIKKYEDTATYVVTESDSPHALTPKTVIPYGSVRMGASPLDQVVYALEDMFGAGDDANKGKFDPIFSIKQFYQQVTGDWTFDGRYHKERSVIGEHLFQTMEALPGATHVVGGGTITMGDLINTTMNKALMKFYDRQERWFEPVVDSVSLGDFKTQTRVRLHNFGSLTERTTDGAEYTELDWDDSSETYTPTEFGNVVSIGRRAIINDDLRGISSIPRLLGDSAAVTINEYVSALFTANSGNGPVLADGVQVFNAGSHQGNRITSAFSRTNLQAARLVIRKMLNHASKRLNLMPRVLLVPVDLEDTAWEVVTAPMQPDNANNAPNVLSSPKGFNQIITVPQWTDANNWYIMCQPEQIVCIEMGYLFGRREPELFLQSDPQTGMVFTNDVITHKIRHDYGGDWIEYRGALASIVA